MDPAVVTVVLAKIENAKMEVLAKHQVKKLPPCLEAFIEAIRERGRALIATGSIHGWN